LKQTSFPYKEKQLMKEEPKKVDFKQFSWQERLSLFRPEEIIIERAFYFKENYLGNLC